MEITAKSHIPVESYGFIELSYTFDEAIGDTDLLIKDYHYIKEQFKKSLEPKNPNQPTILGQTMVENGHTYKAVCNEESKKLYWQYEK